MKDEVFNLKAVYVLYVDDVNMRGGDRATVHPHDEATQERDPIWKHHQYQPSDDDQSRPIGKLPPPLSLVIG